METYYTNYNSASSNVDYALSTWPLTNDMTLDVMDYLPLRSLLNLGLTCKRFHQLSLKDRLWKLLCLRNFPQIYKSLSERFSGQLANYPHSCLLFFQRAYNYEKRIRAGNHTKEVYKLEAAGERGRHVGAGRHEGAEGISFLTVQDGKLFDLTDWGILRIFDIEKKKPIMVIAESLSVWSCAIKKMNIFLGTYEGPIYIWNLDKPQAAPLTLYDRKEKAAVIFLQPIGEQLISITEDNKIFVWDAKKLTCIKKINLTQVSSSLTNAIFLNERLILDFDGLIMIWDPIHDPVFVNAPYKEPLFSLEKFSTHWASVAFKGRITIYDINGGPVKIFDLEKNVQSVKSYEELLLIGLADGTVTLIDVSSASIICTWRVDVSPIHHVNFLSKQIVICYADGNLTAWDAITKRKLWERPFKKDKKVERMMAHEGRIFFSFVDGTFGVFDFHFPSLRLSS